MWKCPDCGEITTIRVFQKEVSWARVEYMADDEYMEDGDWRDSEFEGVLESEAPVCPGCGVPVYWDSNDIPEPKIDKKDKRAGYISKVEEI